MQLSEKERAANRDAFRKMNLAQKAEYIFAYYKLPLVLLLVAVVSLASAAKYFLTHKAAWRKPSQDRSLALLRDVPLGPRGHH